jgi:hypothetical protein
VPPTPDQLAAQLQTAVTNLQQALSGSMHGVLRGSVEAMLAEAQGAEIVGPNGVAFQHIISVEENGAALIDREQAVTNLLRQIRSQDPNAAGQISQALRSLLTIARDRIDLITRAQGMASELARAYPDRLAGVAIGQGGLGPDVGRSASSMVSEQLEQLAPVLRSRGIDPVLIPRQMAAAAAELEEEITEMPIGARDAAAQAAAAAASARAVISTSLARAAGSSLLETLGTALEALWSIGGRLIFLPIIIVPKGGLGGMGSPEEA